MSNLGKEDDDIVDENDDEIVVIEDDPPEEPISEDDIEIVETPPVEETNEDDEPEELVAQGSNDEREVIRERRRKEKQERKERRDNAIKRDKLELDFLRKRNDNLERRLTAQEQRSLKGEINNIDFNIQQAQKEAELADKVIAKAVEEGNGEDVAKAMKYRDQALAKMQNLSHQKRQASQPKPQENTVDEMVLHHANQFMDENPWYDSNGRDEDSAIVMAIDQALSKDGYNPQTEEYWDELRVRAARRLPERFGDNAPSPKAKTQRVARGGPAVGSGKEHAPASTRKEIYISPERKQALMDAGVWDDPVLRKKYVKRYAEYDKENRA